MSDDRLLDDLRAVASGSGTSGEVRERLDDLLRDESMAARLSTAVSAGRDEAPRIIWRALLPRWLERCGREVDEELARFDEIEPAGVDPFIALAGCDDPVRRASIGRHAGERIARRLPFVESAIDLRDEAASRIGGRDRTALLDAGSSSDRRGLLDEFERVALRPFDEPVGAMAASRSGRSSAAQPGGEDPADVPYRVALSHTRHSVSRSAIEHAVREGGGAIDTAPLLVPQDARVDSRRWAHAEVTELGLSIHAGAVAGPIALVQTLDALGRALRTRFLDSLDPRRRRWIDPTFERASGALFRRLALEPGFRSACGLRSDESLDRDLRFDAALAPRLAWAYVESGPHATHGAGRAAFAERVRRAAGRSCWPGEWMEIVERDAHGTDRLRGEMLAILYEERLLTRFGRGWFRERGARELLRELWDAERQATPDDVAAAFALGTMDGATVLERCRPE